jgi:nitrogen regulatory protein PII-like uncharacterized protein
MIEKNELNFFFFGDAISDIHQIEKSDHDIRSMKHELYQRNIDGGVILLARMIHSALFPEKNINFEGLDRNKIAYAISSLEKSPIIGFKPDNVNYTYRVKKFMGFLPFDEVVKPGDIHFWMHSEEISQEKDDKKRNDLIIINDEGIPLKDDNDKEDTTDYSEIINEISPDSIIIYKIHPPKFKKKVWERLKEKQHSGKIITVVNIDELRECGANISRCLSWERTAEDFNREIMNNSKISFLKDSTFIIVKIRNEGALLSSPTGLKWTKLYFDPFLLEGGYDEQFDGIMQSSTNAFIAGLIQGLLTSKPSDKGNIFTDKIESKHFIKALDYGIRSGIHSSRETLALGFEIPDKNKIQIDYPLNKIFKHGTALKEDKKIKCVDIKRCLNPAKPIENSQSSFDSYKNQQSLGRMAYRITKNGIENIDEINFPVCHYGDLICVDRHEIENYQIIKNLIMEYIINKNLRKPLPIAVFGPPGSGKSFGIEEVIKSIPGQKVKKLVFNLSQFSSYSDLIPTFHRIRDHSLKGELPLIFYDEFDCAIDNNGLGWIKFFLQPMQDGCFRSDHYNHPFGKAIFVFAGGIYKQFDEFNKEGLKEEKQNYKVKDFISRLRGYIDIIGIDSDDNNRSDQRYKIRRAIILRSMIKESAPDLFDSNDCLQIDEGVLRAFIKTRHYNHDIRSLQAIVEMSMLNGQKRFEPSALPPAEQLKLHVDADEFLSLVRRNLLYNEAVGRIVEKIMSDPGSLEIFFYGQKLSIERKKWTAFNGEEQVLAIQEIVRNFPDFLDKKNYSYIKRVACTGIQEKKTDMPTIYDKKFQGVEVVSLKKSRNYKKLSNKEIDKIKLQLIFNLMNGEGFEVFTVV